MRLTAPFLTAALYLVALTGCSPGSSLEQQASAPAASALDAAKDEFNAARAQVDKSKQAVTETFQYFEDRATVLKAKTKEAVSGVVPPTP